VVRHRHAIIILLNIAWSDFTWPRFSDHHVWGLPAQASHLAAAGLLSSSASLYQSMCIHSLTSFNQPRLSFSCCELEKLHRHSQSSTSTIHTRWAQLTALSTSWLTSSLHWRLTTSCYMTSDDLNSSGINVYDHVYVELAEFGLNSSSLSQHALYLDCQTYLTCSQPVHV